MSNRRGKRCFLIGGAFPGKLILTIRTPTILDEAVLRPSGRTCSASPGEYIDCVIVMKPEGERAVLEGLDERLICHHIRKAQTTLKGENQLAKYVARLESTVCASILAASPGHLPLLAARRDECRVGADENRSSEGVIRAWTLEVLSSVEGG